MEKKKGRKTFSRDDQTHGHGAQGDGEDFEQLLAESESFQKAKALQIGEEVEAAIIGFDNDFIFLDLGTRLDGMLRKAELVRDGQLTVSEGDTLSVFIIGKGEGAWKCSCKSSGGISGDRDPKKVAALMTLEEAFQANKPVEGKVKEVTKGGFEIDILGLKAFCPISQIDTEYSDTPENHLAKNYTFYIIQFEEDGSNIIVSRREFLKHEANKKAEKLWQEVEEGVVYEGTIKAIQNYGAFVDIGGIEGLLHISEISYERIENPADVLKVGQKLDVAVIDVDRGRRKLSLSSKMLQEDPWNAVMKKLKKGSEYQGKVVRMKTFGAFIELFPGIQGMVHISKLGTDRIHKHPKEVLKIGDIISVRVLDIDEEGRKISLTMEKQEGDYREDLKKIQKEQQDVEETKPGHMSNLVDSAIKEEKE